MKWPYLLLGLLLVACTDNPSARLDYQCVNENNKPTNYWPNVPREVVRLKSDGDWIISGSIQFHYYTENGEFYNAIVRDGEACYPVQRVEAGRSGQTG